MTDPVTFPRWIGTAGWTAGVPGVHGTATLVTAPGVTAEHVQCGHRHRRTSAARACAQRMADYRNAKLARSPR